MSRGSLFETRRLKELKADNSKLKKLLAESELDKSAWKDLLGRKQMASPSTIRITTGHGRWPWLRTARCCYGPTVSSHGSNAVRVKRGHIEDVLLRGEKSGLAALLAPERAAREMQTHYVQRLREMQTRAVEAPRDLQEPGARIERLGELSSGNIEFLSRKAERVLVM